LQHPTDSSAGSTSSASHAEALRAQAIRLHLQGSVAAAEHLYQQILERQPEDLQTLTMFGVLAAQTRRWQQAADLFQRAIRVDQHSTVAYNNLGIVLTDLQRYEEAVASFDRAISQSPEYADAYSNRGVALGHLKLHEQALASCEQAIRLQPDSASALNNRASLLCQVGRLQEALHGYERAIALQPQFAAAHVNRADVLRELSRAQEALASAERAVALQPHNPQALVARGDALRDLQHPDQALTSYEQAITITRQAGYAPAFSHRGALLCELGRPAEALASCEQAIALQLDSASAHVNRGLALQDLLRLDEALASYDQALALDSKHPAAHNNRGTVLVQLQRYDEALASYDRCIALRPSGADAYFNKALCLLLLERFEEGWRLYEWRKRRIPPIAARVPPQPLWLGDANLSGRTVLLHSEQGLGDSIQFCRYARLAERQGARVVLSVQPKLCRLLSTIGPNIEVIAEGQSVLPADYHCPLLSLPLAFGTTIDSIPAAVPYLSAEPERVKRWRDRIGIDGFKIGICWQGDIGKADVGRSFPLTTFRQLSSIPGLRLISLQKHHGARQLQAMSAQKQVEILGDDFDAGPDAFLDTAAVMENLDLIITSDTSIAHVAGALARPTWVALKQVPDWRWLRERRDNPWYPTLRLFRQRSAGDWDPVFADIRTQLLALLRQSQDRR
jgi:tetratricopeptide (TPR) repeat protein